MTLLTKEAINKIVDYWNYDFPSAGMASLKMIDEYAFLTLKNKSVLIESKNNAIDNLLDFLIWKNTIEELKPISVINQTNSLVEKVEIINSLFNENKLNNVKINEYETELTFYNGTDKFRICIGKIREKNNLEIDKFSFSKLTIKFISYYDYLFDFEQINGNKISFKCNELSLK